MTTREQYYFKIQSYKKRWEEANEKYLAAKKVRSHLGRKIKYWQKGIDRIDAKNKKLDKLVKQVNYFFGVRIQDKDRSKKCIFARNVYYKIGSESGLMGFDLSRFIERSVFSSMRGRRYLIKSFSDSPDNLKSFHDFKNYIETEEIASTERRA